MADIKIFCLHCGQHIQCDDGYRGAQINCPSCKQSFIVPQAKKAVTEQPPTSVTLGAKTNLRPGNDNLPNEKKTEIGAEVPEGWETTPASHINNTTPQKTPPKSFQLSGSSPLTTIIVSAALGGYNAYLLSYNGFWVIKDTEVLIWMSVQALFALLCFASVIQQACRRYTSTVGAIVVTSVVAISTLIGFKIVDSDSVDLIHYEEVVGRLSIAEDLAIAPLKTINDKSTDNEILTVLRDTVIPSYESFYTQLESVRPQTSEVQALHRQFLDGAQAQLAGWRGMVQALEQQNSDSFQAAIKLRDSGVQQIAGWSDSMKALESKHGLVHKN